MMVVQIVMNNTLTYYGSNSVYGSDIPLACAGIISKVNMLFFSFVIGISQGLPADCQLQLRCAEQDRVKDAYKRLCGDCHFHRRLPVSSSSHARLSAFLVPVPKSTCILQSGTSAFSCFSHS